MLNGKTTLVDILYFFFSCLVVFMFRSIYVLSLNPLNQPPTETASIVLSVEESSIDHIISLG